MFKITRTIFRVGKNPLIGFPRQKLKNPTPPLFKSQKLLKRRLFKYAHRAFLR